MSPSLLDRLRLEIEATGLKSGTPEFDRALRALQVPLCRQKRALASCWDCPYFDHCELIKAHLRDLYDKR